MAKVKDLGKKTYQFYCPGCKTTHNINCNTDHHGPWKMEGTKNVPTFKPSILIKWYDKDGKLTICHSSIDTGTIQYMSDTTHEYKGAKLEMLDVR